MTKQAQQTVLAAELPERGQPLAGGVFVTRYWLNGVERALILLPDELSGPWGEYGVEIKGAGSYSDGEANTGCHRSSSRAAGFAGASARCSSS